MGRGVQMRKTLTITLELKPYGKKITFRTCEIESRAIFGKQLIISHTSFRAFEKELIAIFDKQYIGSHTSFWTIGMHGKRN